MRDRRSTARGLAAPATFRPQGLVTLSAVSALRARAGLISCRQRSWDSPFGAFSSCEVSGAFPPGGTHVPFLPPLLPLRSSGPARQAAVSGLRPSPESLAAGVGLGRRRLDAPLGFCPSRVYGDRLARTFARAPLTRFAARPEALAAGAPEYRSTFASPCQLRGKPRRRPGNPRRVCAPVRSWHSTGRPPGL
jgi:hypothetical protein